MKRVHLIKNEFIIKIGFCTNKKIELKGQKLWERNLFIDDEIYDYGYFSDFQIVDHYIFLSGQYLPKMLILNCITNELIENDEIGYPQAEIINQTKIWTRKKIDEKSFKKYEFDLKSKSFIEIEDKFIQIVDDHKFELVSGYQLNSLNLNWSIRTYHESHGKIHKILSVFDELVFMGTENSILGIDKKNGKIKWHVKENSLTFKLDKRNIQLIKPEYSITSSGQILKRKIIGLPKGKENSLVSIRDNASFDFTANQMFFSSTVQNMRFAYCYFSTLR